MITLAGLATSLLAGLGLLLLLTAQPLGRPRPGLAERLARLQPTPPAPAPAAPHRPEHLSALPWLDRLLLPILRHGGHVAFRVTARAGVVPARLGRDLQLAGDHPDPEIHYGQKLLLGLLGLTAIPVLGLLGFNSLSVGPVWSWLVAAAVGWQAPDWTLSARLRRRTRELTAQIAMAAEHLALAVSAGLATEQALAETATAGTGAFFTHLQARLTQARLTGQSGTDALGALADDLDLPELSALAGALASSATLGTPLGDALRAQAATIRERRRLSLLAAGQQAQVLMLVPVSLLILPALLLILLFPVAANLLGLTTP